MSTLLTVPLDAEFPFPPYRLTVEQYHEMIREGIIDEDDRLELLEGHLVAKDGHGPSHDGSIMNVEGKLRETVPPEWEFRVQMAVTLDLSELEPDLAVVRGPRRIYLERHPGPADIGQLVEVCETTLAKDRKKAVIYARNRIPVYWIINLPDARVEVYTDPTGPDALPAYRQRHDFGKGDAVPVVLDGRQLGVIAVDEILP